MISNKWIDVLYGIDEIVHKIGNGLCCVGIGYLMGGSVVIWSIQASGGWTEEQAKDVASAFVLTAPMSQVIYTSMIVYMLYCIGEFSIAIGSIVYEKRRSK